MRPGTGDGRVVVMKINVQFTVGDDVPEVTKKDSAKAERNSSIAIAFASLTPTLARLYEHYFGAPKICPSCAAKVRAEYASNHDNDTHEHDS